MERGLLVSTYRGREDECSSEVWYIMTELGVDSEISKLPLPGLLLVRIKEADPIEVAEKIRGLVEERPWDFRYMLKVVPLEVITEASLEELEKHVSRLASKIGPNDKFRVTVNRRSSPLSREDIIRVAADKVDGKVDLRNPDYIVQVEVIGRVMGISVIRPDHIISVSKIKSEAMKRIIE